MVKLYRRNLKYQPVVKEGFPSIEDGEAEYEQFWAEQIRRCKEGYKPHGGRWIPPAFYFALNFIKIDVYDETERRRKKDFPIYRDIDHEFFDELYEAEKNKQGLIFLKPRRKGFTTDMIAMNLHEWCMYRDNEIGVGIYDEDHLSQFRQKLIETRETLPPELRHNAEPDRSDIAVASYKYQDPNDNNKWKRGGINSKMYFRCFGNKPGVFRGLSLKKLTFDEAGENPKLKQCLLASEECFREGGEIFGTPVIGGTSNKLGVKSDDFEEMYYKAENYGLRSFFVPASKWYYPFVDMNKGVSKTNEAEQDIQKEYDRLKKLSDKTAYYHKLQEMPLKPEHAFIGDSSQNKLNIEKIGRRIDEIQGGTSEFKLTKGYLKWKQGIFTSGKPEVEWIPDDVNGNMYVLEYPNDRFKNIYVGGVDTYFFNEAVTSDSMGSCFIYKRYHPSMQSELPVFEYTAHESTTEQFYDNCLKIAVFYNCKLLVEYDEAFGKYFLQRGAHRYLKESPISAQSPHAEAVNRYMIHMKTYQKTLATNKLRDYIETHIDNICFVDLLNELKKYGKENTDRVMSFALCLIHADDVANIYVKDREKDNEKGVEFPHFVGDPSNPIPSWEIENSEENDTLFE